MAPFVTLEISRWSFWGARLYDFFSNISKGFWIISPLHRPPFGVDLEAAFKKAGDGVFFLLLPFLCVVL